MAAATMLRRAAGSLRRGTMRFVEQPRLAMGARAGAEIQQRSRGADFWVSVRFASTAKEASPLDANLLRILKTEIQHESEEYEPPPGLARGPPQPFKLEDKPGQLEVILRRSHGQEDIALTCMYQPGMGAQEEGEYDDDDMPPEQNVVHLTVAITKGPDSPVLELGCVLQKDLVTIGHVHYLEDKSSKEPTFDGPDFSQLDEHLQTQFKRYLDARGINEDLANYLLELMEDKEQREYARWLRNIHAFIKK